MGRLGSMTMNVRALTRELETLGTVADTTTEKVRTATAAQQQMGKELAALMQAAAGGGTAYASEGFGFAGPPDPNKPPLSPADKDNLHKMNEAAFTSGKSGGFLTVDYALQLVRDYVLMMEELKKKTLDALIRTPQIRMGMDSLEQFFRQFFPQFGDLEKLAKQMWDSTHAAAETVEKTATEMLRVQESAAGIGGVSFKGTAPAAAIPPKPTDGRDYHWTGQKWELRSARASTTPPRPPKPQGNWDWDPMKRQWVQQSVRADTTTTTATSAVSNGGLP